MTHKNKWKGNCLTCGAMKPGHGVGGRLGWWREGRDEEQRDDCTSKRMTKGERSSTRFIFILRDRRSERGSKGCAWDGWGRAGLGTGRTVARLPGGAQAVSTLVLYLYRWAAPLSGRPRLDAGQASTQHPRV